MTVTTALMMTVTFTMAFMMLPKIYWTWIKSEELFLEGELWRLRLLQAEENGWVRRHLGYGALLLLLAWLSKHGSVEVSQETTAVLGLYSGISLAYAVAESLLARRIEVLSRMIPFPAKVGEEG
ncbi:hypothetical protein LPW11_11690 [Geomonas sp. RF6]|uniref:hypothetical protein n=1 Tax=Geomonas sp. RF6 TaxID=2897342 RepID=UPI001E5DFE7E|nr:hypothetical protein [Geomonas sp. RF6]UFS68579.1 hypothetical protein LPW11_11690 [Geomonas sp. RF6]